MTVAIEMKVVLGAKKRPQGPIQMKLVMIASKVMEMDGIRTPRLAPQEKLVMMMVMIVTMVMQPEGALRVQA